MQTLYSWPPGYYRPFCVLIGLTGDKDENQNSETPGLPPMETIQTVSF